MSLKFKRHYPVILLLVFVLAFFALAIGDQRIIVYTVKSSAEAASPGEFTDITNDVALFDETLVHSIQVIMSEADYDLMISTYQETGIKDYFHADIIIDGVRVNDVGIRLKGNASLRSALGGGMGGPGGGMRPDGERPEPPDGMQPPEMQEDGEPLKLPEGFQPPEMFEDGQMPQFPGGFGQLEEGEVKIPFMIKFDEFVSGQTYQGYTAVAIRTYGISPDEAMLQEPVTNAVARLAGLPVTRTAYTGFQINDEQEKLYVVSEVINEEYLAEHFENAAGVLYKAEVGSTLSYLGEDPSAYDSSFTQQTRVNDADLSPLIDFMRFLDEGDDAAFESRLPDYMDVDAFAAYLALNNLLVNTDSVAGMNNNYYLYYDDRTGRFTLLLWDTNESLGGLGRGGQAAEYDLYFANQGNSGPGEDGPAGFGRGENTLMKRFMANANFKTLYESKLKEIYELAFVDGAMADQVNQYAQLIRSINPDRNLVDITSYDQNVESVLSFIDQRTAYLETTALLGSSNKSD